MSHALSVVHLCTPLSYRNPPTPLVSRDLLNLTRPSLSLFLDGCLDLLKLESESLVAESSRRAGTWARRAAAFNLLRRPCRAPPRRSGARTRQPWSSQRLQVRYSSQRASASCAGASEATALAERNDRRVRDLVAMVAQALESVPLLSCTVHICSARLRAQECLCSSRKSERVRARRSPLFHPDRACRSALAAAPGRTDGTAERPRGSYRACG